MIWKTVSYFGKTSLEQCPLVRGRAIAEGWRTEFWVSDFKFRVAGSKKGSVNIKFAEPF
jgi:hypothetical protein